jgi:hypothetical protein
LAKSAAALQRSDGPTEKVSEQTFAQEEWQGDNRIGRPLTSWRQGG